MRPTIQWPCTKRALNHQFETSPRCSKVVWLRWDVLWEPGDCMGTNFVLRWLYKKANPWFWGLLFWMCFFRTGWWSNSAAGSFAAAVERSRLQFSMRAGAFGGVEAEGWLTVGPFSKWDFFFHETNKSMAVHEARVEPLIWNEPKLQQCFFIAMRFCMETGRHYGN